MKKRALLVGCNYPGTKVELHGCANDVRRMHETLISRFGFDKSDIDVLVDTDESERQPTGANIRCFLANMFGRLEPKDVLVFYFSGHATQVPSEKGEFTKAEAEEAIVPTDMNLLTGEDFKGLLDEVPVDATFTFISDSCHSSKLIRAWGDVHVKGSSSSDDGGQMGLVSQDLEAFGNRDREIPVPVLRQILGERTGHRVDVGNIRATLLRMFGDDASPSVKVIAQELSIHQTDAISEILTQRKMRVNPVYLLNILLSGCRPNETSADVTTSDGESYGAFSNAIQTVLGETDAALSNRELILQVRKSLQSQGFKQHPFLYCSDGNAQEAVFICN